VCITCMCALCLFRSIREIWLAVSMMFSTYLRLTATTTTVTHGSRLLLTYYVIAVRCVTLLIICYVHLLCIFAFVLLLLLVRIYVSDHLFSSPAFQTLITAFCYSVACSFYCSCWCNICMRYFGIFIASIYQCRSWVYLRKNLLVLLG